MTVVAEILKAKAHAAVQTIAPDASVLDALRIMAERQIGALLVVQDGRIEGILTERDYARKIALLGRTSADTPVREVMTRSVMFVHPNQTSEQCMQIMTDKRLRHLPVLDGEQLIGIISIGDLVADIISEQKFIIEQMTHYIGGNVR
ncbi:MAG: CBS domain-containing protein [Burkholderiales bacterium]|nr:CBS domain-containing protein [Burkholderiales bacterium]